MGLGVYVIIYPLDVIRTSLILTTALFYSHYCDWIVALQAGSTVEKERLRVTTLPVKGSTATIVFSKTFVCKFISDTRTSIPS